MEDLKINESGDTYLFHDKKGYEDEWRKHHQSSITRDVWMYKPASGNYTKLTTFKGEDRNPVFSPDGNSFYYLSEQDGTFNVYKAPVDQPQNAVALTSFTGNPVRFLSIAKNGTLCFG